VELLKQARSKPVLKELGKHPETDENLQILKGRFGPYVTDGKTNVSLPKGTDPESVTLEQAVEMLKTAPAKGKAGKTRTKKSTTRATTAKKSTTKSRTSTRSRTKSSVAETPEEAEEEQKPAVRKRFIKRPATK
jgi:DNA topoisomerase-1